MAYTPVPSVAAGDWIDEIFINTYWRDNMAAGVPDVFSAKGQLAVGTGVDTMGVLGVGANNTILVADSAQATGLKWAEVPTPKMTRLGKSANQSLAVGVITINWDTEAQDDEGLHDNVTNNSRITFAQSGKYRVETALPVNPNCTRVQIDLNGTTVHSSDKPAASGETVYLSVLLDVAASDYVEVKAAVQTSPSTSFANNARFLAIRLGA